MVTLKLTSGIEGGSSSRKRKNIRSKCSKNNNIYPQVFVSADKYTSEQKIKQTEKLTLTKNIEKNENNEYKWDKENDVIYVTYIYHEC